MPRFISSRQHCINVANFVLLPTIIARNLPNRKCNASIGAVRKLLAITFLALFGLPLVQPLFALTARSEANLLACCRRGGKHRCMENMAEHSQSTSRDPQFQVPAEKCPYCPAAVAVVHDNAFVPPTAQAIFAALVAHPAVVAQTESKLRISRSRSRQKRGPPASLSL
jgi:Protein of unknown function (DUF2946)